jgi:hypothetical protein
VRTLVKSLYGTAGSTDRGGVVCQGCKFDEANAAIAALANVPVAIAGL